MGDQVKVIILRTAGTNCDEETAYAFRQFGAQADLIHINRLLSKEMSLSDYHILALPGGFTYGDDIMSGRILANELRLKLGKDIERFVNDGKLILGICNGFQVLVRSGLLPGPLRGEQKESAFEQKVSLSYNDSGKFEDRWTYLKLSGRSVWTEGMNDVIYIPVAHAEGKFIPKDEGILAKLKDNGQIIFCYCDPHGKKPTYPENPNGSISNIAGIADKTGRILGLMPHPERHFQAIQHPFWTRRSDNSGYGQGAKIFENGVKYIREKFIAKKAMEV